MSPHEQDGRRLRQRLQRWGGAFTAGIAIASAAWWVGSGRGLAAQADPNTARVPASAVKPAADLSDAFVTISAATTPAVVNIEARVPPQSISLWQSGP